MILDDLYSLNRDSHLKLPGVEDRTKSELP